MRKAGVDHSVIMKLTGHKSPSMFLRYNTVDLADAIEANRRLESHMRQEGHPLDSDEPGNRGKKVLP